MAINPEISLAVKPVQLNDPLKTAGEALSIRGAQQNQALGAQQLQSGALGLQQKQQEIADQQTLRQAQIAAGGDIDKTLPLIAGKVSPQLYTSLQKASLDRQEQVLKLDEGKGKETERKLGHIASNLGYLLSLPEDQAQAGYTPMIQRLNDLNVDTSKMPQAYPGREALQASFANSNGWKNTFEQANATRDQQRKDAEEKRAAAKAPVELGKLAAETTAAQQKTTGTEPIQPFQAATLAGQAETRAQTAAHNTATEANEKALRSIASGNLGVAQQHVKIAQDVYDQTYGAGANPALVGVEPKLRTQAASAAQKAADEFTKAMESTANVQTFIEMAKKGNKAAGSNLPIMGAESIQALNGIRRINRTEIEQYQGAGSLLDKIQGRIGKLATGQPIPADVMKDIEDLHKAISGNAASNYNTKLDGINQNYHAQFKPVGGTKAPAAGAVPEITSQADYDKLPKGAKYTNGGVPHVKQ